VIRFDTPSHRVWTENLFALMIRVDSLSYRYPGADRDALRSICLQFAEGSFTAIMGANGSGKSTLARCLNGLLYPTSGRVLVDGWSTAEASALPAIRRQVGLVFQDPNTQMTSPTIERELAFGLQNIGLPTTEMHQRVEEELQRLGFTSRRDDPPATLSGGEKQRLALASVMMLRAKYLVLDEPTTFLSPTSRLQLMEDLSRLHREQHVTVILITQHLREAHRAERIVVLENGTVAFDDSPQVLVGRRDALRSWGIVLPRELRVL
jgi:energy-coupling factor transport system ATP-binding protein